MVQEFNETISLEKGIIVEAFSQGNISDLTEKVVDAANKKVGLVAELDRYLTEEELNEYRSEYLEEGRFDKNGALKIFPTAKSTEVMILNSTDWKPFAQATGVQLSDLETMEGVVEVGRQYYEWTDSLTEMPNDGKAFWGQGCNGQLYHYRLQTTGVGNLFCARWRNDAPAGSENHA